MKKLIPILTLLLLVSCATDFQDKGMLGTWQYTVKDAPFGFQTEKVIFFEEDEVTRAKLKVYGISIKCDNLIIEEGKVSFTTKVEHEDVLIKMEMKDNKLIGMVQASEGGMSIEMIKRKGRKNKEKKDSTNDKGAGATGWEISTGRAHLKNGIEGSSKEGAVNYKIHTFYYGWYGNPESDGKYNNWNHPILPHWIDSTWNNAGGYSGGEDIGANFYPQPGSYSSTDPEIISTHIQHPAVYKIDGKPLYYLYNSFQLKYYEWQSLLNPDSTATIRNTPFDGIFIGLWTTGFDGEFMVRSGFDGFCTYFASDGFAYGSTTSNWPEMAAFARENNLIYIPCVGPGYEDTRIRPWNEKTTKSRDQGQYYEKMFEHAVNTSPDFIGITSFNEWHEGTQIEPAIPKEIPSFTYVDYGEDTDPMFYIRKTKVLIEKYIE